MHGLILAVFGIQIIQDITVSIGVNKIVIFPAHGSVVSGVGNMTTGCFSKCIFNVYFHSKSIVEHGPGWLLEREKSMGYCFVGLIVFAGAVLLFEDVRDILIHWNDIGYQKRKKYLIFWCWVVGGFVIAIIVVYSLLMTYAFQP